MSCYLKEIIDQIIEIDALAYDNKTKNEQILSNKKQEYESMISAYREEKISAAKVKAKETSEQTDAYIMEIEKSQKEQIKKISAEIDDIYLKAEKNLTQKIFNKLFVLEG